MRIFGYLYNKSLLCWVYVEAPIFWGSHMFLVLGLVEAQSLPRGSNVDPAGVGYENP